MKKLLCKIFGHNWSWFFDDSDYLQFKAGNCQRCGEVGDGLEYSEPNYPAKEDSQGITRKGN